MPKRRINNTTYFWESMMLILVFFMGFWLVQNSSCNKTFRDCNPIKTEISLTQSNATVFQGIQLYYFNGWISNNDYLKVSSLNRLLFLSNKNINNRIFLLEKNRKKTNEYLISFIQNQLFHQESDDPLILS